MRFFIYPKLDGRYYEVVVEHFPARLLSDPERFVVHGKKRIFIESNRPFFRNKGIKHRRPDYKLITKDVNVAIYFDEIVKHLDEWVKKNLE